MIQLHSGASKHSVKDGNSNVIKANCDNSIPAASDPTLDSDMSLGNNNSGLKCPTSVKQVQGQCTVVENLTHQAPLTSSQIVEVPHSIAGTSLPPGIPSVSCSELSSVQKEDAHGSIAPVPELVIADQPDASTFQSHLLTICNNSFGSESHQQHLNPALATSRQHIASAAEIDNSRSLFNDHQGVLTRSMTQSGSSGSLPLPN